MVGLTWQETLQTAGSKTMEFVFIFVSPPLQKILMEHASDDPKLSFTGKPIVKWPKRVS